MNQRKPYIRKREQFYDRCTCIFANQTDNIFRNIFPYVSYVMQSPGLSYLPALSSFFLCYPSCPHLGCHQGRPGLPRSRPHPPPRCHLLSLKIHRQTLCPVHMKIQHDFDITVQVNSNLMLFIQRQKSQCVYIILFYYFLRIIMMYMYIITILKVMK